MRRFTLAFAAGLLSCAAIFAPAAQAEFGFQDLDVTFTDAGGSPATQAGSHPFAVTTTLSVNRRTDPDFGVVPDGEAKNIEVTLPAGLVGDRNSMPQCSSANFFTADFSGAKPSATACPDSTAVGVAAASLDKSTSFAHAAVYNLVPPPGVAAKIGFSVLGVPGIIEFRVSEAPPFNLRASVFNVPQLLKFFGSELTLWGNPVADAHDPLRGQCVVVDQETAQASDHPSRGNCPLENVAERPFITLPRSCTGPLVTGFEANSWQEPGVFASGQAVSHDGSDPPNPLGMTGCAKLGFSPTIAAQPTTVAGKSPSGLDFSLDVADEGLTGASGFAQSDIRRAVVTLPEGMTVNPSAADGLAVCTPTQYAAERSFSSPGQACPEASKLGTVRVDTPLLEGVPLEGALYLAQQDDPTTPAPGAENPFDSLLAMYVVIRNPGLGILIKQPLKVVPDPVTGRLTTVADDLPQLPFSHFQLHFREGARSPLVTPPACGSYEAKAELTPWSGGPAITTTSAFQITVGPGGGPCPTDGLPPFKPGLVAGTLSNAAGHYSPFNVRLFRSDSEQEITRFSIKLPPGITGKLAGIPFCPDAAIESAKSKTGTAELASPSCPAASEIGRTLAGAGVGSALVYAPGKLYLAGPYHGSAISMASITAAKVGPFDLGTVVVRLAFKIDRETAEVFIDSTGSDPLPHIIDGVPTNLRDIRAYTDRPEFVLNPTSCARKSTVSTLLGAGLDFGSEADDRPVTVATPFQAADCAALGFEPKLSLRLRGGTKRGDHPAFRAILRMKGSGESNIKRAQVTLPRSEFIENAHFKSICTRVQFRVGQCPPTSVYGFAKAATPLLDEPLEGPVYLRSSEHQLPDLVAALHSQKIDFDLVGHVDSVKGRLRNTFEAAPDAPVSSFVLSMRGGQKGLFVNSTDLCKGTHRAVVEFSAHNGKVHDFRSPLLAKCGKGRGAKNNRQKRQQSQREG